jgi:agmatinase
MSGFDPNGVGVANGNIFGFPVKEEEADIIIMPVPWDVTTSYGKGTANGPAQVLEASTQLDFFHPECGQAYNTKVFITPISEDAKRINDYFVPKTSEYISYLEEGGLLSDSPAYQELLKEVEQAQDAIKDSLRFRASEFIQQGKIPAVLGGEHSVPLGLIQALADNYESFGILQLDAHADLRDAYEGFAQSHASIFFNALKIPQVEKLVQVGIRDVAESEVILEQESEGRIKTFYDWQLKSNEFEGKLWSTQVDEIIAELPDRVYISYDIDALRPELCPNTGTPVPGGFTLEQLSYLLMRLAKSGKQIIGFDLCEVSNGNHGEWDANVGARALWSIVIATEVSRRQTSAE